ncbi:MAG: YtxH domain-containing protein [Terriglobales bacterium]
MADSKGFWFIVGLGVGAAVGLLYAPRSGGETRELLGRKAGEGRDAVTRRSSEWRQQASDYMDRGRDVVSRQVDQFQAAVDAGRQAYRESTASDPSVPRG